MPDATSIEMKKITVEYYRDHWDHHIKNVNYLLVAHGATLVGCLAALKDYNSTPQLRGIGLIILAACVGMAAASVAHGLISYTRSIELTEFHVSGKVGAADGVVNANLIALVISFLCFIASLCIVAYKFSFL